MEYKLIALDLDETLLNRERTISERNRAAVKRAQEAGVQIVLASGRIYDSMLPFRKRLGLAGSYTISTGGAVLTAPDGSIAATFGMDPELTWALMNWAAQRGIYFQVYTEKEFLYQRRTRRTDDYERVGRLRGREDPELLCRHDIHAGKVLYLDTPEKLSVVRREVERAFPGIAVETSHPTLLEMSRTDASKGNALKKLGQILNIPREQMIAMGDSEIDRSMIRYAGLGVAMENAKPSIKALADYVAPANTEDGVAEVIDRFIFGKN